MRTHYIIVQILCILKGHWFIGQRRRCLRCKKEDGVYFNSIGHKRGTPISSSFAYSGFKEMIESGDENLFIEQFSCYILSVEKDTADRMQVLVQDYFNNVLQAPCPDFTFNYHNRFVQGKK